MTRRMNPLLFYRLVYVGMFLTAIKPPRTPWGNFPDVLIHAGESAVKQHPAYKAAKPAAR